MKRNATSTNLIRPFAGTTLILLVTYLFYLNGSLNGITRPYAPPGQSMYVLSKASAILVYLMMWWQIMLGMTKRTYSKYHMIFGISVFLLILSHALFFVTAVSIRQEELSLAILIPNFTIGYYKTGLSLGVFALFFIFVATISGVLRKRFQKLWKIAHACVYATFLLATAHGLMIGSEINSGLFSYVVYGAVFSLVIVFMYQKLSLMRVIRDSQLK